MAGRMKMMPDDWWSRLPNDGNIPGRDCNNQEYKANETLTIVADKDGEGNQTTEIPLMCGSSDDMSVFEVWDDMLCEGKGVIAILTYNQRHDYVGMQVHCRNTGRMIDQTFIQGYEANIRTFGKRLYETGDAVELADFCYEYLMHEM